MAGNHVSPRDWALQLLFMRHDTHVRGAAGVLRAPQVGYQKSIGTETRLKCICFDVLHSALEALPTRPIALDAGRRVAQRVVQAHLELGTANRPKKAPRLKLP